MKQLILTRPVYASVTEDNNIQQCLAKPQAKKTETHYPAEPVGQFLGQEKIIFLI